jgi:hypothetical protein
MIYHGKSTSLTFKLVLNQSYSLCSTEVVAIFKELVVQKNVIFFQYFNLSTELV